MTAKTWIRTSIAAVGVLVLSGCGGAGVAAEGDFERARELNLGFKQAVAAVQERISDGEWRVGDYGDMPQECSDGVSFRMTRYLPVEDGWRFPEDPQTLRAELAEWLETNGYTDVTGLSYEGDVDTLTVTGRNPHEQVSDLTVQFHPGEVQDGVSVFATSTCAPSGGGRDELVEQIFPGYYSNLSQVWPTPETESPSATPIFGYTAEGEPLTQ